MSKRLFGLFVAAGLLASCSSQRFILEDSYSPTPDYTEMQQFFIGGLGQTQRLNAGYVCEGEENITEIRFYYSPLNWLLGTVTYGIYTPRDVEVHCRRTAR